MTTEKQKPSRDLEGPCNKYICRIPTDAPWCVPTASENCFLEINWPVTNSYISELPSFKPKLLNSKFGALVYKI